LFEGVDNKMNIAGSDIEQSYRYFNRTIEGAQGFSESSKEVGGTDQTPSPSPGTEGRIDHGKALYIRSRCYNRSYDT
jgi:hypothetical protein